jgi:hypothetical protein
MAFESPQISRELTNTIISLQETIQDVKQKIRNDQPELFFDPTQPVRYPPSSGTAVLILTPGR